MHQVSKQITGRKKQRGGNTYGAGVHEESEETDKRRAKYIGRNTDQETKGWTGGEKGRGEEKGRRAVTFSLRYQSTHDEEEDYCVAREGRA